MKYKKRRKYQTSSTLNGTSLPVPTCIDLLFILCLQKNIIIIICLEGRKTEIVDRGGNTKTVLNGFKFKKYDNGE